MDNDLIIGVVIFVVLLLSLILFSIILDKMINLDKNVEKSKQYQNEINENKSVALAFSEYIRIAQAQMKSLIIVSNIVVIIFLLIIFSAILFILKHFCGNFLTNKSVFDSHLVANELIKDNDWREYLI